MSDFEELYVGGSTYSTRVTPKYARRKAFRPNNAREIRAVIPGQIRKLLVTPGQQVDRADTLLIMDAMKMQNPVQALRPGTVKKIHVNEGQVVPKGELLIEFE